MKSFSVLALVLMSALAADCSAQAPSAARASDRIANLRDMNQHKISLKLEDVSERQALETLFKKIDVIYMYILDPLIDTRISLSVENVPFEGALVSILRSVRREPLFYQPDEAIILSIFPGRRLGENANMAGRRVWLDFDHVDVRYALK